MASAKAKVEPGPAAVDRVRAFAALDNPTRLKAFRIIQEKPGMSFNDLADALAVETGLAAYHVGVLKATGVVEVVYTRAGRSISSYRLAPLGAQIHRQLFGPREVRAPDIRPTGVRRTPRARGAGP